MGEMLKGQRETQTSNAINMSWRLFEEIISITQILSVSSLQCRSCVSEFILLLRKSWSNTKCKLRYQLLEFPCTCEFIKESIEGVVLRFVIHVLQFVISDPNYSSFASTCNPETCPKSKSHFAAVIYDAATIIFIDKEKINWTKRRGKYRTSRILETLKSTARGELTLERRQ